MTTRQLAQKKISPFPIIFPPSAMSYTLRLPGTFRIHPVCHVSQLEPDQDREQTSSTSFNRVVHRQPEYPREHILGLKVNRT